MFVGVDTDTVLTLFDLHALKAWGADFVARYLQSLKWAEVQAIKEAGLQILSIYESNPTYAGYFTPEKGKQDGLEARFLAERIGQPAGTPVFATVDTDLRGVTLRVLNGYLPAFAEAVKPYTLGVYGGIGVVRYAQSPLFKGLISAHWQTVAWSDGMLDATQASVWQLTPPQKIAGVSCDVDIANHSGVMWSPKG